MICTYIYIKLSRFDKHFPFSPKKITGLYYNTFWMYVISLLSYVCFLLLDDINIFFLSNKFFCYEFHLKKNHPTSMDPYWTRVTYNLIYTQDQGRNWVLLKEGVSTGCFFPKNSLKFATSPLPPTLGCFWLYRKTSKDLPIHDQLTECFHLEAIPFFRPCHFEGDFLLLKPW